MAKRNIRVDGDSILLKRCREVTEFNKRLHVLIDDMRETLLDADGVGLAAPQVGILRRVVLVRDISDEELPSEEQIIELINPVIVETHGMESDTEGCLSVPGIWGIVRRPDYAKVRAQDRFGNFFEVEGTDLTARCFCHEIDHLDGHLFTEFAERLMTTEEMEEMEAQKEKNENGKKRRIAGRKRRG